MFRLRGKGATSVRRSGVGDLICRTILETPVRLDEDQRSLLDQFGKSLERGGGEHSPKGTSWIESVKHFFDRFKN